MVTEGKQIEKTLKLLDETWSKVRPGTRLVGMDREGVPCVFICENLTEPIGRFESDADAKAFAESATTVELLSELVKKLVKERDEAREAIRAICSIADPALEAFNEQRPVDMASVLKTTHHWGHYILSK